MEEYAMIASTFAAIALSLLPSLPLPLLLLPLLPMQLLLPLAFSILPAAVTNGRKNVTKSLMNLYNPSSEYSNTDADKICLEGFKRYF